MSSQPESVVRRVVQTSDCYDLLHGVRCWSKSRLKPDKCDSLFKLGDMGCSGVYVIISNSNKFYIGSSSDFKKRWCAHLSQLRNNKHHNEPLQRAFAKYGEAGLIFFPIIYCDPKDLIFYEQLCIDTLLPEYNSSNIATNCLGVTHSDAAKKNMSLSKQKWKHPMFGKKHTDRTKKAMSDARKGKRLGKDNHRSIPVICKETGVIFDSVSKASDWVLKNTKYSKATCGNICHACSGKLKSAYGYTWSYASVIT